jgi:hypothetical protein
LAWSLTGKDEELQGFFRHFGPARKRRQPLLQGSIHHPEPAYAAAVGDGDSTGQKNGVSNGTAKDKLIS